MKFVYLILFAFLVTNFDNSSFHTLAPWISIGITGLIVYFNFGYFGKVLKYIKKEDLVSFGFFIGMFAIGIVRTNIDTFTTVNVIQQISILFLFIVLTFSFCYEITVKNKRHDFEGYFKDIIWIPLFFIIVSSFLTLLKVDFLNNNSKGLTYGSSVLLEKVLRMSVGRFGTPLGVGTNNYGLFAGYLLTICLTAFWTFKRRSNKIFVAVVAIFSLIPIFCTDTRSALIWPIVTVVVVFGLDFLKRLSLVKLLIIPISVVLPILVLSGGDLLKEIAVKGISRSGNDIESGNHRLEIWKPCWREMQNFKITHFFGYGNNGDIRSGVAPEIELVFGHDKGGGHFSTHNNFFQLFLDYGYIGLVVFFVFIFGIIDAVLSIYSKTGNRNFLIFISIILFTMFGGMAETNMFHELSFHFFILISIAIIYVNCNIKYNANKIRNAML